MDRMGGCSPERARRLKAFPVGVARTLLFTLLGNAAVEKMIRRRSVAWEWDADNDRILTSTSLRDLYGISALTGVSQGFSLLHPDDYERHQTLVHAAVDRGRGYRSSFRIIRPDTERVVWIDERAEAIGRGGTGPPMLIGVAFDAGVRHHRGVAPSVVRALDALEAFGDALLTTYAANLRHAQPRATQVVAGQWIQWAESAFSDRDTV